MPIIEHHELHDIDHRPIPPRLILEELLVGERRPPYVARMVIQAGPEPTHLKLGLKHLFFFHMFIASGRPLALWDVDWTVVGLAEVLPAFREWVKSGYLSLGGKDRDDPKSRIAKIWHNLVRRCEDIKEPEDFLRRLPDRRGSQNLFALHLPPAGIVSRLPAIDRLIEPRQSCRDPH